MSADDHTVDGTRYLSSGTQIVLMSDKPFRLGETRLEGEPQRFTRTVIDMPDELVTYHPGGGTTRQWTRPIAIDDFINAKEDTMAKRQTKAQKNAARREKYAAKRPRQAQDGPTVTGDEAPAPTTAMMQPPPNIESLASFIGAYMLFQLGFELNEIGELFCTSTLGAGDRVKTGQVIAERNGLSFGNVADRNRAMRQNKFGDFARKAATAMQDRIVIALPAFIRSGQRMENGPLVAFVTAMVKGFTAEDVVANIPIPNQGDKTAEVGQSLGRAADGRHWAVATPADMAATMAADRGGPGRAGGLDRDPRVRPTLHRDTGSSKY